VNIEITQDTTPRELATALTEAVDGDDLADLVRLLPRSSMPTNPKLQALALRTAADLIEGLTTDDAIAEGADLARVLADPSWFDEVLFGTLDNVDHPEGVDLFDRETYATIRREVLALIARANYGPVPIEPRKVCAVCGTGWAQSATPPAHSSPYADATPEARVTHDFVEQQP
jgi:hypothetical protein